MSSRASGPIGYAAPTVLPIRSHQARAWVAISGRAFWGTQSSISSILTTGLKGWSPKVRSGLPLRSPRSATESEEVVVARSARGQVSASVFSSSAFGSGRSTIDSITRSQRARSEGSVVTLTLRGSPSSTLAQRAWAVSSACHADASERASRIVFQAALAQAASPQAMVPLPAIPGRPYPSPSLTARNCYHAGPVLRSVSEFAAGRRSKWVIIAAWLVAALALGQFQPKLQEATTNENEAFLPESAEATEVQDILDDDFAGGREVEALVVYTKDGQLTGGDRQRIADDVQAICAAARRGEDAESGSDDGPVLTDVLFAQSGFGAPCAPARAPIAQSAGEGPSLVSDDGTTALTVVTTNSDDSEEIMDNVEAMREIVPEADAPRGAPRAYVTGTAGFISDSVEVFETIDVTLLMVTVSLVLILLLLIYCSPVIALVPLLTVGIAYTIAAAAVYGLVEAGAFEVNGQTTSILIVLMFGAGTDYCLLIVARY